MPLNEQLYQDPGPFDMLAIWGRRQLETRLPTDPVSRWGWFFYAFSLLLGGLALMLLLSGLQPGLHSGLPARFLAGVGLTAASFHFMRLSLRILKPRRTARASRTEKPAASTDQPTSRTFFRHVRTAGINVAIARALFEAGIRSSNHLQQLSDAELLALHGVGPATLRKLRAHFPTDH